MGITLSKYGNVFTAEESFQLKKCKPFYSNIPMHFKQNLSDLKFI
jgi:hypothetical protein